MEFDMTDWVVCGVDQGVPSGTDYVDISRYCVQFEANFETHQRLLAELTALQAYQENFMSYEDRDNLQEYFDSFGQMQMLRERVLQCELEILRHLPAPVIDEMQVNRDCLCRQVVLKAGITRNRQMLEYLQHLGQCSRLTQYGMETETQIRCIPFGRSWR